ncbi:hypothetical protein [Priestia koreensis]|uniref:hypothetical protein n=1 Tax=Priestia koreensis TaxID=284581 RepID=UPI001F584080|nr:hypothetical protein [Priestia koreensis]UNL87575.1 hypothetical protein IE339_24035 [Priestia koreensis]
MNYYEVGYIIISTKDKYLSKSFKLDNLSTNVFSISNYVKPTYPDEWFFSWVHNIENEIKRDLNLSKEVLKEAEQFLEYLENSKKFSWPNIFASFEDAILFKDKFLFNIKNLMIVKICIPEDFYEDFLINEQNENDKEISIYNFLKDKKIEHISSKERKLGFDICGYLNGNFYSFICNGLQDDFLENNIQLNRYSLIEEYKDAKVIINLIDNNKILAEEILWYPWLLIKCI